LRPPRNSLQRGSLSLSPTEAGRLSAAIGMDTGALTDATGLPTGHAGIHANGTHQGVDPAGGDAIDPSFHDHAIQA
jgi:hypothetical protein